MATIKGLSGVEPTALYGLTQVAQAMGVCWDTVDKLVRDGKLPHRMVGTRKKVLGMDVLAYVGLQGPVPRTPSAKEIKRKADEMMEFARNLLKKKPRGKKAEPTPAGR